eukprot:IDg2219t1
MVRPGTRANPQVDEKELSTEESTTGGLNAGVGASADGLVWGDNKLVKDISDDVVHEIEDEDSISEDCKAEEASSIEMLAAMMGEMAETIKEQSRALSELKMVLSNEEVQDVDKSCGCSRGRGAHGVSNCSQVAKHEISRMESDLDLTKRRDYDVYPAHLAFKVYQKGLEDVRCKKVGDSSFFAARRTWDRLNNDFPVTEGTKKRLLPLAFDGDARHVYEEVANNAVSSTIEELRVRLQDRLCNNVHQAALQDKFFELRWNEKRESFSAFAEKLRSAALALPKGVEEDVLLNRLKAGLPPRLRDQAHLVTGTFDEVVRTPRPVHHLLGKIRLRLTAMKATYVISVASVATYLVFAHGRWGRRRETAWGSAYDGWRGSPAVAIADKTANNELERVCLCTEDGNGSLEDEVLVRMDFAGESWWIPVDTAAKSIWVDEHWFLSNGGNLLDGDTGARAADGHPIELLATASYNSSYGAVISMKNAEIGDTEAAEMDVTQFSEDEKLRRRLRDLIWKHRDIFKGFAKIKGVKHKIKLKPGTEPICCPPRRRSPKEEELERQCMGRLLEIGVLEQAVSPWAANNVFVPKKDSGTRVTTDFRSLNNVTVTDAYPMEDVRDTIDWLARKRIFSAFDLKDGFYQVELDEESKPLTAVRTVIGLLQYTRLPQGLKNSPGTFQRIVNLIQGDRKGRDVLSYVDDTSVGTETEEDHLLSLEGILTLLYESGVRLKLSKCTFGVREVEVLGHKVGPGGVKPSDKHVKAIRELVEPASVDELMRFLGLANYFSIHVDHFSELAKPLYDVLKGTGFSKKKRRGKILNVPDWNSRWGSLQVEAWQTLKDALSDPQILVAPKRGLPKKVMSDASSYGLRGVLLQQEENGDWLPVAFTSRQLKKAELAYPVHQKECLAIVHALKKWRHYLYGEKFLVVTDQMSLKWLLSLQEPRDRLARWVLEIQDYDFDIVHAKGTQMTVPDTLSRDAVSKMLCQRCYNPLRDPVESICAIREVAILGNGLSIEETRKEQMKEFGDLNEYAEARRDILVDEDGVLRIARDGDLAVVVPEALKVAVLSHVHGSRLTGHYRFRKTLARMRGRFWWKEWISDIAAYLKKCVPCTVSEDRRPGRQARMEIVHPKRRFSQVAFDVQTITPKSMSGNTKVLAIVDVFTRFVRAVPIPDERASTIANALINEWISLFGPMERLLSDRGPSLIGEVMQNLTAMLGIKHLKVYPLHPQANGTVERWNRTLTRDIASFMSTGLSDWDEHVALACFRYNTGTCEATDMTPYKAMFGVDAFEAWNELELDGEEGEPVILSHKLSRLHKHLVNNALRSRLRAAKYYDKTLKETEYKVGDRVLLWSTELAKREGNKGFKPWIGPYTVISQLGRVGYELKSEVGDRTARVHANRLRRIDDEARETGNPEDGVFPDCMRLLKKIAGSETRINAATGQEERWFKVQIGGRKSSRWTKEVDLPEVVVKMFDDGVQSREESDFKDTPISD